MFVMYKLLNESILIPFIYNPIKLVVLFALCILRIKKFSCFFNKLESYHTYPRVVFFKTLYFNFRSLPFKLAIKCPIFLYEHLAIISSSGNIRIEDTPICAGMIRWGRFDSFRSQGKTRINNKGTIIFKGKGRMIRGNEICVWPNAVLSIGDDFFLGENTMIYCQKSISIGKSIRFAYHSQMFDTDFHYSMNINSGEVHKKEKAIVIGDYNWFGNKTTIKKGTKTPNHLTVAGSYSLLGKDYTKEIPEYSVIGGVPAKLLLTEYSRIWNNELHRIKEINEWFSLHPKERVFTYDLSHCSLVNLTENESK